MNKNLSYNQNLVTELGANERIIIWSIREWKKCILTAKDPIPPLIYGLTQVFIEEISVSLDNLLREICTLSLKPIDIRCHCSQYLGETEHELLLAISYFQSENSDVYLNMNKVFKYHKEINHKIEHIANLLMKKNLLFEVSKRDNFETFRKENIIYHNFNKNKTLH